MNTLDIIRNNDAIVNERTLRVKQSPKGQFCRLNGRLLRRKPPRNGSNTITNNVYYKISFQKQPSVVGFLRLTEIYSAIYPMWFFIALLVVCSLYTKE